MSDTWTARELRAHITRAMVYTTLALFSAGCWSAAMITSDGSIEALMLEGATAVMTAAFLVSLMNERDGARALVRCQGRHRSPVYGGRADA